MAGASRRNNPQRQAARAPAIDPAAVAAAGATQLPQPQIAEEEMTESSLRQQIATNVPPPQQRAPNPPPQDIATDPNAPPPQTTLRPTAYLHSFQATAGTKRYSWDMHTDRDATGNTRPKTTATAKGLDAALQARIAESGEINLEGINEGIRQLLEHLAEVNGQDAYSNETAALGKLNYREFLVLPSDLPTPIIEAKDIGSGENIAKFSSLYVASVYALNKALVTDDAVKFAMIRLEAVKLGWYSNQREVRFTPTPADALDTFARDSAAILDLGEKPMDAAFLVPLAAEHTFRTHGHHYLTGLAADYTMRYAATFRSCLRPEVATYLPPAVLYHKALHWISPGRVWEMLMAQKNTSRVPEAIKTRLTAAPAGCAVITTVVAVMKIMDSSNYLNDIKKVGAYKVNDLIAMNDTIRSNPVKWHKVPSAYGLTFPSADDLKMLDDMKKVAENFCPVAKGFITALMKDAPISRQKVLDKYALQNPALMAKARRYFIKQDREAADSIMEVFATALKRTQGAVEEE